MELSRAGFYAFAVFWFMCCVQLPSIHAGPPVELSDSVILVSFSDLESHNGRKPVCEEVARRSARWGSSKISMVVTPHWVGGRSGVQYYAYKDSSGALIPASWSSVARWRRGLQRCFKAAVDAGFTHFHILPHIDDPNGLWRNGLVFDPYKKHNGFSYVDTTLGPAADALNAVIKPHMTVDFNLQGEMGRTLLAYPRAYIKLLGQVKTWTSKNGKVSRDKVRAGVSLNWSRHCGCVGTYDPDPVTYNRTYGQFFNANRNKLWKNYDVEGFKQLLWKCDFIGLSGYGMLPDRNVQPADFEIAIHTLVFELSFWGLDSRQLFQSKPLIVSEWGLGGSGRRGRGVAGNRADLARFPVHGMWVDYNKYNDPWARWELREYRTQVYRALLTWLRNGGGPAYTITGMYQWSVGTFDVLQVHPVSTNAAGTFGDKGIQDAVMRLNRGI